MLRSLPHLTQGLINRKLGSLDCVKDDASLQALLLNNQSVWNWAWLCQTVVAHKFHIPETAKLTYAVLALHYKSLKSFLVIPCYTRLIPSGA